MQRAHRRVPSRYLRLSNPGICILDSSLSSLFLPFFRLVSQRSLSVLYGQSHQGRRCCRCWVRFPGLTLSDGTAEGVQNRWAGRGCSTPGEAGRRELYSMFRYIADKTRLNEE